MDPEIDNDEAHARYASLATAFIVTQVPEKFDQETLSKWTKVLSDNQVRIN